MTKWLSRKFVLAFLFGCVGSACFLMGMEIGAFTTFCGVILGTFTAGDVGINAIHKRGAGNPDNTNENGVS